MGLGSKKPDDNLSVLASCAAGHAQHLKDKVHDHVTTVAQRVKRHEEVLGKTASADAVKTHFGRLVGAFRASEKLQDEKNNAIIASLGEHQNIIDGMKAGFDNQRKMIISQGAQLETQGVELDEAREKIEFLREKIETVGVKRDRS